MTKIVVEIWMYGHRMIDRKKAEVDVEPDKVVKVMRAILEMLDYRCEGSRCISCVDGEDYCEIVKVIE